jgi:hypothetical protein
MAYFLLFALVATMLGASVMNYQTDAIPEALATGGMGLGILVFSSIYLFLVKPAQRGKATDPLLGWIMENKQALQVGGSLYYGQHSISRETQLTAYCWVLSVVTLSMKSPGKWNIKGTARDKLSRVVSTIFNLVFGWWGIPWGPVFTIQSLLINLAGRWQISVGDVLSGKHEVEVHK